MINIADELKQLYKADSIPKNLQIYFPALNLTITNSNMVSETFELTESLSSEKDLVFGSCESTQVKFTVADITQDLKEQKFTVTQIVNGIHSVLLGTYTVKSAKKQDNLRFKDIVAYDDMKKFEIDVADWYNSLDFTNMTLKQFRSSLCAHVGVVEDDVTLTNDNMLVTKTIEPSQLSGKEVLQAIEEINGCFGHIGRDGKLKHIVLQPAYGLYPSEILYPSDVLFPVSETDTTYVQDEIISESLAMSNFRKVRFEEYTVKEIDKLQIRQETDDIGAIVGTGINTYIIEGNFLVFGKSASELETVANNTFGNIRKRPYRPYNAELNGLPYIELGDVVQFQTNDVVEGYVLSRTLKGIQALKDNFSATGNENRKANFDLNKKVIQLQGKTAIIKKNVDEVSVEVSDLEKNTNSKFQQTDEQISFKVSKNGVIGAINLSSEEATISAKKLNFNGYATFDVDGKITGITGNLIKTGFLESTNYVVGTSGMKISLDDGTIDTPKFKLSSDGKITAVDGTFSGVIQNERVTIEQQFIRFSSSGHIAGYNNEPILGASGNEIRLGNAYNSTLTTLMSQARSIIWGGAFGNSVIQMIGKTIFKTSDFRTITVDDTGIYPDSSNYYALGKASQRWDYAHIRSVYVDLIYHQSSGSIGFFGKTPISQRTVTKLSTSATLSDVISKFNTMLDVFGDSSGYGLINV